LAFIIRTEIEYFKTPSSVWLVVIFGFGVVMVPPDNIMLRQYVSQKLHAMIIILLLVLLHCISYAIT